jgi:hypothetical protein
MTLHIVASLKSYGNQQQDAKPSRSSIPTTKIGRLDQWGRSYNSKLITIGFQWSFDLHQRRHSPQHSITQVTW